MELSQRAPPNFGRAAMTLGIGIGPHSSWFYFSKLVQFVISLFLYHFVCFIVYFIVHAALLRIKVMMMMMMMIMMI